MHLIEPTHPLHAAVRMLQCRKSGFAKMPDTSSTVAGLSLIAVIIFAAFSTKKEEKIKTAHEVKSNTFINQLEFQNIINETRSLFKHSVNDIQRDYAMYVRRDKLCAIGSRSFNDWHGILHGLSTNRKGEVTFSVKVGDDAWIEETATPSNAVWHGLFYATPGTPLKLSGNFLTGSKHCFSEAHFLQRGAMLIPEYRASVSNVSIHTPPSKDSIR